MTQNSETTRYLCGAAQLDQDFANRVISEILDTEYKAINLPSDVDVRSVITHCLHARKRKNKRDLILTVIALLILFSGFFLLVPGFLVAYGFVFFESWTTRYKIIANSLLKRNFSSGSLVLEGMPDDQKKLGSIEYENSSNVVVYSGYSPFVGAGYEIGGWSFAIDISKGKEELGGSKATPKDFKIKDIHDHIEQRLKDLGLTSLTVKDELYVNGQEIRDDKRFLPTYLSSPVSHVDTETIESFIENPTEEIRHYKVFRIVGWKGDIVISIFLRFVKVGKNLFSEASYALLPPLKEQYRSIDEIQQDPSGRKKSQLAAETFMGTIFLLCKAPFSCWNNLTEGYTKRQNRKRLTRLVQNDPTYDYGATTNIRELASSDRYRQYFQRLDKDMYIKLAERHILDSIIDFLNMKDIDTREFKDRQTIILNNGVMMSGGSFNAKNVAVGSEAQASSGGGFSLSNLTTNLTANPQQTAKN